MAFEQTSLRRAEEWRQRIRVGAIISAFQSHVEGKRKLSATQIRAGEVLLSKVLPSISNTQIQHDVDVSIRHITIRPVEVISNNQPPALIEHGQIDQDVAKNATNTSITDSSDTDSLASTPVTITLDDVVRKGRRVKSTQSSVK